MAKRKNSNQDFDGSYGIAEWYGRLYKNLNDAERRDLLNPQKKPECRFLADFPQLAPAAGLACNKKGGVCSIRSFTANGPTEIDFGDITATCPNRFIDDGLIIKEIGRIILGADKPLIAKEIPFLKRPAIADQRPETNAHDPAEEDVGRIDLVCVHPDQSKLLWCAVELQAVYFSGGAMSKDFAMINSNAGNRIPMPGARRRPDFRSSGPKRLMPQLQIKVPTLRRWGKKMVVVVDEPFFEALGPMDKVEDISNCDICWIVVRFEDHSANDDARMSIASTQFTTLERAVEGLTAGEPTTLDEFETKMREKLTLSSSQTRKRNKKKKIR